MILSKRKIVLLGARIDGQAGVVLDCIDVIGGYEVVAFLDYTPSLRGAKLRGIPVVGTPDEINSLRGSIDAAHISIGDNFARYSYYCQIKQIGIPVDSVIHPSAVVSKNAYVGEGAFIGPNSIINTGAKLGSVCIVNSGAIIEHDNVLGNAVHFSVGCRSTGRVQVDDFAFIGAGATLLPDILIGMYSMIGAGATVVRNVSERSTLIGYAAQKHKKNIYQDAVADVDALNSVDLAKLNWNNLSESEKTLLISLIKKLGSKHE